MRWYYLVLCFLLLAACQPKCDQKIICDDGLVFPAEHMLEGACERVEYLEDPCPKAVHEVETLEEADEAIPVDLVDPVEPVEPVELSCTNEGGAFDVESSICTLGETVCDAQEFMDGLCPEPQGCAAESPEQRAACCQEDLSCDIADIAVFHENTGSCTCEPTDIQRSCAAFACEIGHFGVYDVNIGECICVEAGTGQAKRSETEIEESALTAEDARQLVIDAFDEKWGRIPDGCGVYKEGKIQPDEIKILSKTGGAFTAQIAYYCGLYASKPAEPDHNKELTVTSDGKIIGLD